MAAEGPRASSPSSAVPGPAPRRARGRWPIVVLVAIGVVLAAVAVVFLLGGSSSAGGSGVSYSSAARSAAPVANATAGGPWTLVVAAGIALAQSTLTAGNGSLGSGCTYTSPSGGTIPTQLFVPAFSGSFASGVAPWWGLIYYRAATQSALLVNVVNGSAEALLVATGSCTSSFQSFAPIPSSVVDSSVAAAAVWKAGGSAFASQHSGVPLNMEMALLGGGSTCLVTAGPCWVVHYSPCNPLTSVGPSGSQPSYTSIVDGSTGGQLIALANSTTCSTGSTPLGSVLGLGSPTAFVGTNSTTGCAAGDSCETVPIVAATGGLSPANFTVAVVNSTTHGAVSGVVGFSLLNVQGQVVVSAAGNPGVTWIPGVGTSTSPLSATMTFVIDLGHLTTAGSGYAFLLTGVGDYSGTVEIALV